MLAFEDALPAVHATSLVEGSAAAGDGPAIRSVDPWTGTPVTEAHDAGPAVLQRAVAAAAASAKPFGSARWSARGDVLARASGLVRDRADALAQLAVREVGKPAQEARAEVERTARVLDYYAGQATGARGTLVPATEPEVAILTRRRPIGPCLMITPWNFPFAIPAWKIAPALACGNPVIWKPATAAMGCASALAACLLDAGLAEGALSLVLASGRAAVPLLDENLAAVSFTGSTDVGEAIRARVARRGTRMQGELGGKNVAVVLDDAGPEAAEAIARAAFGFAGQKCTATSVVIATPGIRDELAGRLAELTRAAPWGDPREDGVWGGPVIDAAKRDELEGRLAAAAAAGDTVLARGPATGGAAAMAPALVAAAGRDSTFGRREVFGPVLTILDAVDDADLARVANDTEYGLVASVFGRDIDRVRQLCNQLDVGMLAINRASTGLEVQAPTGGWKASGSGDPEQGEEAIRFFTKSQTIYWKSAIAGDEFP